MKVYHLIFYLQRYQKLVIHYISWLIFSFPLYDRMFRSYWLYKWFEVFWNCAINDCTIRRNIFSNASITDIGSFYRSSRNHEPLSDGRGTYFLYALCLSSKVKNRRIAEMHCQSNLFFVDGERKNVVTEDVCRISERRVYIEG